jgi:agmatine deiminase
MPDELKLRDEKAARILESVFPDRKVIMLDALAVNLGGGGIHCISMQQPAFIK